MQSPAKSLNDTKPNKKHDTTDIIKQRQSQELVIAFCGAVGSGVSKITHIVEKLLKEKYKYQTQYIKVSNLIKEHSSLIKKQSNLNNFEKTRLYQREGNELRKEHGDNILAKYVVNEIAFKRGYNENDELKDQIFKAKPVPKVTLVDSLKHPEEAKLLKFIYGNSFYLFGILCPEYIREKRMVKIKRIKKEQAVELISHDKKEEEEYGQKLINTIQYSDFFIRNTGETIESLNTPITRFLDLIFGSKKYTPTTDEFAMFIASSSALKSGCLSRQVGAALVSSNGDIISTGCNDVPKAGGGLYTADCSNDTRCLKLANPDCQNDLYKKRMLVEIESIILSKIPDTISNKKIDGSTKKALANDIIEGVKDKKVITSLLEYSRAIHAEMDALITALRNGNKYVQGSSLYCTTYPCHICARHLITAGIKKVFYIQPYEKSLACELHDDAISLDIREQDKVQIIPFEGVAPRQYMNMFEATNRKQRLTLENFSKPHVPQMLDSYLVYEAVVATEFNTLIEKILEKF